MTDTPNLGGGQARFAGKTRMRPLVGIGQRENESESEGQAPDQIPMARMWSISP